MAEPSEIAVALTQLREFIEQHHWPYCLIGGLAVVLWGQPRYTQDIDLVVLARIGDEEPIVNALLSGFSARLRKQEARDFALSRRVLLLQSQTGVPIDISLGTLGFEEEMLRRARSMTVVPGAACRVALAEDVIVMKTIAGRPGDWQDIEGIIAKQAARLDWQYIDHWLVPLLIELEMPERADQLKLVRWRLESEAGAVSKKNAPPKRSKKKD